MSEPRPYKTPGYQERARQTCGKDDCGAPVRRNRNGRGLGYCAVHIRTIGRARSVGEEWTTREGYVWRKTPAGNVAVHRMVMEEVLGRSLLPGETVHHLNGDRADNRPENLELWYRAQPAGQRVADLVRYVVENHPEKVLSALLFGPCEPRTEVERGNVAWPTFEALQRACSNSDTQQEAEHE